MLALLTTVWAAEIEIEVSGLESNQGVVVAALFAGADGFPTKAKQAVATATFPIASNTSTVAFTDLEAGEYAVSMFHDANANGKMDNYWFGAPKEGVVASNGAKGRIGPPSFDAAKVAVDGAVRQSVTIDYLFR